MNIVLENGKAWRDSLAAENHPKFNLVISDFIEEEKEVEGANRGTTFRHKAVFII